MEAKMKQINLSTFAQLDVLTEQHTFPSISPAEALTLGRAIIAAMPKSLPQLAALMMEEVEIATDRLEMNLKTQGQKAGNRRAAGSKFDLSWGSFHARLDGLARLPADSAEVEDARAYYQRIFDSGLSWLRASHVAKWGTSSGKLALIEQTPGMRKRLIALCSAIVIETLEDAHLELGEALGIGAKVQQIESADAVEALSLLRVAVSDYVRVVLGSVNRKDPKSIDLAEQALEPIGRFRAMILASRRGNGNGALETPPPPEAPAPVVASPPATPPTSSSPA